MPCCDAYIPTGALEPAAEAKLVRRVTEILVDHEMRRVLDLMHDPKEIEAMRAKAESIAWTFVHKVDTYVNGTAAKAPYYRFIATVPEGMIDDRYAPAINRDIFAALKEAEEDKYPMLEGRIWIHIVEILDERWGAGGRVTPLKHIVDYIADGWGDGAVERWNAEKADKAAELVKLGTAHAKVAA